MTQHSLELNHLLLSLLVQQTGFCGKVASQSVLDRQSLLTMAAQHRLEPLLYWRLTEDAGEQRLAKEFTERLAASDRQYTFRSLQLQHALVQTQRALHDASIPAVFLKGAFLAFHVYRRPGLRPLRDLDVLVPRSQATAAFEVLLRAGFRRDPIQQGSAAEAALYFKHLPPLAAPVGRVLIELHTRLVAPHGGITRAEWDLADDPDLWRRLISRPMSGEQVTFLAPTDQLLHLIIHAVFDHGFQNGPLVLTDLIFLLNQFEMDWPRFWQMAAAGGWLRGVWLLLSFVKHFYPPLRFELPPGHFPARLTQAEVAMTSALMMEAPDLWADVQLNVDIIQAHSSTARGRVLLQRLCPSRHTIAAHYPRAEGPLGLARAYVAHWWRLGTVRLPGYLANRRKLQLSDGTTNLAALKNWLRSSSHG